MTDHDIDLDATLGDRLAGAAQTATDESREVGRLLDQVVERIAADERVERLAGPLSKISARVADGPYGALLHGEPLGHVLHPALTDLPIGCWTSAMVLDVVGGRHSAKAAQRLIGIGLLTVPLTAAAGIADWNHLDDERDGRVGAAHAWTNGLASLCFWRSWSHRRRGHRVRGIGWSIAGASAATFGAHLGGHLVYRRGANVQSASSPTEVVGPAQDVTRQGAGLTG